MIRAATIVRKPAVKADRVCDTVVLDHEDRHRRRIVLTARGGLEFLLDLDKATVLNDGDAVKLEDGRLVRIEAAPQRLIKITANSPERLLRLAWHIGNRHTPAEISEEAIYIEEDHVLAEMVRGLGGGIEPVIRGFSPEKGAYHDHGDAHNHHGHDHHAHDHHGHDHHGHAHHEHGPDCGCGHDHAHHDHAHHDHAHHDHAHDHGHKHAHTHDHHHDHQHGPDCGCGHDHAHHDHAHHDHHNHHHGEGHSHAADKARK